MQNKGRNSIRSRILAIGVGASLALVSLGFATHAEARVKGGDHGDLASTCRAYQTDYDNAMDELARARAAENYQKAYELRNRIALIHDFWDNECSDTFGSIAYFVVQPVSTLDAAQPTTGGVFDPGKGSSNNAVTSGATLTTRTAH